MDDYAIKELQNANHAYNLICVVENDLLKRGTPEALRAAALAREIREQLWQLRSGISWIGETQLKPMDD